LRDTLDIEAYYHRIGYTDGSREPTLETLSAIHLRHPQAIPFENLDPLLQRPVGLDVGALERKLLRAGRGGWCFEQNLLLAEALRTLGFRVTGLAARVMWNVPEGVVRARSHMLLLVDAIRGEPSGSSHIADVGFGGLTLTAPLRLATDVEQATPHDHIRQPPRAAPCTHEHIRHPTSG
jgi:N-hydroxyarylamine O-acetyltransferase